MIRRCGLYEYSCVPPGLGPTPQSVYLRHTVPARACGVLSFVGPNLKILHLSQDTLADGEGRHFQTTLCLAAHRFSRQLGYRKVIEQRVIPSSFLQATQ